MSLRPLKDNLIVEKQEKELKTETGIVLTRSDEADKAVVVAVGPEVDGVYVGDVLLINWQKAPLIEKNQYKVSLDDVIAIFED